MVCHADEASFEDTQRDSQGFSSGRNLFDASRTSYAYSYNEGRVTLSREDGIAHIYIEFDRVPEVWTVTDPATQKTVECGTKGFLHEYVNITQLFGEGITELELVFPGETYIGEIYGFSAGELPQWVQIWQEPLTEADLLLISSHSDDEQLFFAGILPYYTLERGLQVQVAYTVQHFEANGVWDHRRPHEQLDGLWTVGVRNYPVMSSFPDLYSESTDRDRAFASAEKVFAGAGVSYDDFCSYITECLRRFKPLVVVSHDLNGEYGHGTHVLTASALTEAIGFATDPQKYPESAEEYGCWQVEKTYLHLYGENKITMDWDTPYDSMGGKTPFEMTQAGFDCHKSQHWCWFYDWLYGKNNSITKATQISGYSPCEFGLYNSQVGVDVTGGDFFENVENYAQRKAEEERLAAESSAAAESESVIESLRAEESLAQDNQTTENNLADTDNNKTRNIILIAVAIGVVALAVTVILIIVFRRKNDTDDYII